MRSDNSNPGNIAIHGDHTTLYCKCNQASDMRQQLELGHERESDPEDTVGWSRKWLVDFNAGKTQLFSFDWSNNFGAIDVKMYESVLQEKLWDSFSSKLDCGSYIVSVYQSITKTASKKMGSLIHSMKFLSPEVGHLYKSIVRPCMEYFCHVWAGAPSCYLDLLDKL